MAGLAHDGQLACPIQIRLGGQPRAQGMAGILGGIEAGRFGGPFYDQAHGILVQANRPHAPMAIDAPKQRAFPCSRRSIHWLKIKNPATVKWMGVGIWSRPKTANRQSLVPPRDGALSHIVLLPLQLP